MGRLDDAHAKAAAFPRKVCQLGDVTGEAAMVFGYHAPLADSRGMRRGYRSLASEGTDEYALSDALEVMKRMP